jgi:hypothetical protein
VECKIEQLEADSPFPVNPGSIKAGDIAVADLLSTLAEELRDKLSQWVYIKRELRLYENDAIYIYKSAKLINWTRTQAMIDATEIIGSVVARRAE